MDDDIIDAGTGKPRRHDGRDPWSLIACEALDPAMLAEVPGAPRPLDEAEVLAPGDAVLLLFKRERLDLQGRYEALWVEVTGADGAGVSGVLDNQPTWIRGLAAGDPITFERAHVLRRSPAR